MAGFGRSFKPPSYLSSMTRRPPPPTRTMSASSDSHSPLSSPDIRQDDVILSARPSPRPSPSPNLDFSPQRPRSREAQLRPSGTYGHSPSRPTGARDPALLDSPRSTPARTKPIAIELPTKKVNSAPVYTPPAPLSARGDLPGGYFPLHEDQNRVYHPHPFQLDASKAHTRSIERANREKSPDTESITLPVTETRTSPSTTAPPAMADRSARLPPLKTTDLPDSESNSRSNTPVASYMPTGAQDSPLPMGKYYPSNYVKRKEEKKGSQSSRPLSADSASPIGSKSESQVPTIRDSPTTGHARNESEAKRRLQQYQRDMIAQATLALNGGNVNAATLNSLRTMGFSSMSKPSKPRLVPLGSPGPVTPMELEGSGDGYLGARGSADGPADAQAQEIARAIRAEEERKRREGATSPAVELGPSSY
ncbi:hypothetical protein F4779DRAFT_635089 [Xylariaceae sp. FL0662B]|nr:hypothetical protein F4779DRAFT_635089 [Xylariaceae sp. FL0662B]